MKKTIREYLSSPQEHPSKALPAASAQIRIPTQRPVPQHRDNIERQTKQVTKEWNSEASHTDTLSPHLSSPPQKSEELAPKRIQRIHTKRISTLLRKMAKLQEGSRKKVGQRVAMQGKLVQSQDELWSDMMKPHEERHYQIGRITNYFS